MLSVTLSSNDLIPVPNLRQYLKVNKKLVY